MISRLGSFLVVLCVFSGCSDPPAEPISVDCGRTALDDSIAIDCGDNNNNGNNNIYVSGMGNGVGDGSGGSTPDAKIKILHGQECPANGVCPPTECFFQMCIGTTCMGVALPDGQECLFTPGGTCLEGICVF